MGIPTGFIQDLLARVDVVDVVGRYVQLKKTGANLSGLCPFHSEKSPSFTVSPGKQFYHCFGCGKSGDAIRFLMEHNGMTFVEAVTELAQQHGLQVPDDRPSSPEERAQIEAQKKKKATLADALEKAGDDYRKQLKATPAAIDYLKRRGLTGAIAARFGLGYAPQGWRHLSSVFADYTDALLEESGLVIRHEDTAESAGGADSGEKRYDRFRHRVMFPIRNVKGECIGFGGRVLDDSKPKYLNSPETAVFSKGRELYGLFEARDALREHGYVLVTEGYMDVVALAQLGFGNAVATLGTACTADHVHKLFRYTDKVVFSFDGDAAGRRAAHKALLAALPYATDTRSVKFLFLPSEHDPDSYIRAHGPQAFDAAVKSALPLSQFLQQAAAEGCDLGSAEGRAHMASNARPLWQALPDGVLKTQLLGELAGQVQVAAGELRKVWESTAALNPPAASRHGGAPHHAPQGGAASSNEGGAPPPYASGGFAPRRSGSPAGYKRPAAPQPAPFAPRRAAGRTRPASGADHALRLLLLHMPLWESLSPDDQSMLCALPAPHGDLFAWLDSQFQEHGALAWNALDEALHQHMAGDLARALVQQYQALALQTDALGTHAELQSVLQGLAKESLARQADAAAQQGDATLLNELLQRKRALAERGSQ